MIVAGVLSTGLVAMNYSRRLVDLFTFIILLATLSTLVPYAFCALAGFMRRGGRLTRGASIIAGWRSRTRCGPSAAPAPRSSIGGSCC